jgi:antitoxin component YwqK of YwqJK toxin-antitoxin module
MIHTHYENGKEHGECKQWYPNGQMKLEKTYKEGKLNGPCKEWYDTGVLKWKANYTDDQQDGDYESWFENGQIQFQGTIDKTYKQWSIDGKLIINTTSS